jgi:signal transduction histidine kinase
MTLRVGLVALGLLLPLNLPFSVPPLRTDKLFGWTASTTVDEGGAARTIVTHTTRHGRAAGLRPGDVLLEVAGTPAASPELTRVRAEAVVGDTLLLKVQRGSRLLEVPVGVSASVASYSGYIGYRVVVVLGAWVVGMGLLIWRGRQLPAVVMGGALILLAPGAFPNGVPGESFVLTAAQRGWQLQSAAERIFVPVLLCHFLALHIRGSRLVRSVSAWAPIYLATLLVLFLVTDGFMEPLARARGSFAHGLRQAGGGVGDLLAIGSATVVWLQQKRDANPLRWVAFAIVAYAVTSLTHSAVVLLDPPHVDAELIRRGRALVLTLVPLTAALHFRPAGGDSAAFMQRFRLASYASRLLAVLYGSAVAGAAAVVLSATQTSLGGTEWLLFLAIFLATILFSPVTRWAREIVDRRVFAQWVDTEADARVFAERVGAELEPERIARRAADALPALLDVATAELVLDVELTRSWGLPDEPGIAVAPREEMRRRIAAGPSSDLSTALPITGRGGELMGMLVLGPRGASGPLSPPEQAIMRTIVHGLASALRNAETYVQLRRAQQELAEAERITAIGALAGGLAHEIKNPLASLKIGLHLLERAGADTQRLRRIHWDVRRIDDLVSGLLHYSDDASSEQLAPVDLRELAHECALEVGALANARSIRIDERYPRERAMVVGCPERLRLVISNLLTNALDAVDEKGRIEIGIGLEAAHLELVMKDTGSGIRLADRDHIFKLNFSTKPGGTGLGLALARREIDRLKGSIELLHGDKRGTTLRVLLPRAILPA